jgi:hypothetical protein
VLAKNFPSIRPDLTVRQTIASGVQGSAMPAWSQANGGPLSDGDINDLTVFILTLPDTEAPQEQPAAGQETALSWLSGWGGVLLALVLVGIIIAVALLAQRRKPE